MFGVSVWLQWCLCLRRDTWSQSTTAGCACAAAFSLLFEHCWNQERLQSDVIEIVMQIVKMVILLVGASQHVTCVSSSANKCSNHLKQNVSLYCSAHYLHISKVKSLHWTPVISSVYSSWLLVKGYALPLHGLLLVGSWNEWRWNIMGEGEGGWIKEPSSNHEQPS